MTTAAAFLAGMGCTLVLELLLGALLIRAALLSDAPHTGEEAWVRQARARILDRTRPHGD